MAECWIQTYLMKVSSSGLCALMGGLDVAFCAFDPPIANVLPPASAPSVIIASYHEVSTIPCNAGRIAEQGAKKLP